MQRQNISFSPQSCRPWRADVLFSRLQSHFFLLTVPRRTRGTRNPLYPAHTHFKGRGTERTLRLDSDFIAKRFWDLSLTPPLPATRRGYFEKEISENGSDEVRGWLMEEEKPSNFNSFNPRK